MAEEETGFTFVDKRRAGDTSVAEPPSEGDSHNGSGNTAVVVDEIPAPETAGEIPGQAQEPAPETSPDGAAQNEAGGGEPTEAPDVYALASYCLQLFAQESWQKMGLIGDPRTGLVTKDLEQAKVAIDLVSDIAAKLDAAPEDRIPQRMKRDLRTLLNDLRLNYVSQRGGAVVPPA